MVSKISIHTYIYYDIVNKLQLMIDYSLLNHIRENIIMVE